MIRSVTDWEIIMRGMNPKVAARRVFGDIHCYSSNHAVSVREEDDQQLANALEAWHRLRDKQSL